MGITSVGASKLQNKGLIVSVAVAKLGNPTQESNVNKCVIIKTILGSIKRLEILNVSKNLFIEISN